MLKINNFEIPIEPPIDANELVNRTDTTGTLSVFCKDMAQLRRLAGENPVLATVNLQRSRDYGMAIEYYAVTNGTVYRFSETRPHPAHKTFTTGIPPISDSNLSKDKLSFTLFSTDTPPLTEIGQGHLQKA